MNTLVFQPKPLQLTYTMFSDDRREAVHSGKIENYRFSSIEKPRLAGMLDKILDHGHSVFSPGGLDLIAVRVPFGGTLFKDQTLADASTVTKLEQLIPQAPFHLPPIVQLIQSLLSMNLETPIVLMFETSFFTTLPEREYLYGLDSALTRQWQVRRYGFHGIFHDAACRYAQSITRKNRNDSKSKILSICLENRPEITAVLGNHPKTVTSGVTPLEGLPGRTTSGELDSSIILLMAQEMKCNAEKINKILSQESGWLGLTGRDVDLQELFQSKDEDLRLAREILQYRILLAAGAGIAALSGLDCIVFSGEYASVGEILGPWLSAKLPKCKNGEPVSWLVYNDPLDRIIADRVAVRILAVQERICG